MTEVQGYCLEWRSSEVLIQAFLFIRTTCSLLPGFGMPPAVLEHLIQPHHRPLAHGEQHALLLADHLLERLCTWWQSSRWQESLMLSAAELGSAIRHCSTPQCRRWDNQAKGPPWLSWCWWKVAFFTHQKPNLSWPVKFCCRTCKWIINHLRFSQVPSLPMC